MTLHVNGVKVSSIDIQGTEIKVAYLTSKGCQIDLKNGDRVVLT